MKQILLLAVVSLLFACDDDSKELPNPGTMSNYFPLEVGNWWIYSHWNPNAKIYEKSEIIGTKTINGNLFYEFSNRFYDSTGTIEIQSEFYRMEDNRIYKYYSDRDSAFIYIDLNYTSYPVNGEIQSENIEKNWELFESFSESKLPYLRWVYIIYGDSPSREITINDKNYNSLYLYNGTGYSWKSLVEGIGVTHHEDYHYHYATFIESNLSK